MVKYSSFILLVAVAMFWSQVCAKPQEMSETAGGGGGDMPEQDKPTITGQVWNLAEKGLKTVGEQFDQAKDQAGKAIAKFAEAVKKTVQAAIPEFKKK